ncbi:MAG TPA: hypothetical protein VFB01_11735 [Burkholderiales bacterium]|nr:hypothetical protein [Burkholderiales bacterium]
MDRRAFLAAGGALALGACAAPRLGEYEPTVVEAPQWRAGDSWTFRRIDGYNGLPRDVLTRTVSAVSPAGIRFVTVDQNGATRDDALFEAPGVQVSGLLSEDGPIAGLFEPRLVLYDFPLYSGKAWRQGLYRIYGSGFRSYLSHTSRAEGWEGIAVGARTYRAILIHRTFNFGPRDSFTPRPLYHDETEWYVPELRGTASLRTNEWLQAPPGGFSWPGYRFVYSLESFRLA